MAITYIEALLEYLKDAPREWAQVIAARAAIRVLPYAFGQRVQSQWVSDYSISLFRATSISWAAVNCSIYDMRPASQAANFAAWGAGQSAVAVISNDSAGYEYMQVAAQVAYAAAHASGTGSVGNYVNQASLAVNDAHACSALFDTTAETDPIGWANINADCVWLAEHPASKYAALAMAGMKLWPAGKPEGWSEAWASASELLATLDLGYGEWIDWYNRRIEGHDAAFDVPGDHDRTEDKKILARLADATNKDFWDKGATYVNTTLQGWIDEARERVRPRDAPFVTDPLRQLDAAPEPIPPQNQNAIPFTASEDGKIRIDLSRNSDGLRTDGDAQDRYGEAIREARALFDRCRLSNSAARFVSGFENYLSAGGETLADLRPSLFVQRGEKLRQEIAAYESGQQDSFLEPIADDLLIDLKGWRSAHNMAVGLDPLLMRLDTAMLGPDVKPTLIAPSELHAFVADADEANILDDGVREIVDEAIDLAPDVPDPNDRRTVWSVESVQNLVIEAFSVALNHPVKTAVGVGFTAAVGMKVAAGVAGGALVSAKFLIKHRTWIETRLNNTPTWQSLFNQICDRLEEWTPFKSSKDDDGV